MFFVKIKSLFTQVCKSKIRGQDPFNVDQLITTMAFKEQVWKNKNLAFLTEHGEIALDSQNLDYNATASLSKPPGSNSHIFLQLKLRRKITRSVIQIILPPALLVMISWV